MPDHKPGLALSGEFYAHVVRPLLGDVPHAACLIGEGSEVLGFDTERSTDHAWGLRLQVLVSDEHVGPVRAGLDRSLPDQFDGWPVRYFRWQTGGVAHHIEVATLRDWLMDWLSFDPRDGMSTARWLATPQQLLLEVTAGEVFHDEPGELSLVRTQLGWFPDEIWLWLMACEWSRVGAYEPIVGRTAEVGDELGSDLAAGAVVRHLTRLRLLQTRRYSPYAKWLGSTLQLADPDLARNLDKVMGARDYSSRESALGAAYLHVAQHHNQLTVTEPVEETLGNFDVGIAGASRPYRVLNASRFARALQQTLGGSELLKLGHVGSIDQLAAPTDEVIHFTDWAQCLEQVYATKLGADPQPTSQVLVIRHSGRMADDSRSRFSDSR